MALKAQSLFLFGYSVDVSNQNLDFQASSGGPVFTAVIPVGNYSLTSLLSAIALAMNTVDSNNTYTVTADRTLVGGTQNKIFIATNGAFLSLLFNSGPNAMTAIDGLIGFNPVDYTGGTTYSGAQTTGQTLIPTYIGYTYRDTLNQAKVFGAVNVSAAGLKEAVVFNIQQFIDIQFKYEAKANLQAWQTLFYWLIQQNAFDFTPEITNPDYFFQVTLEKTDYEGKGLGYQMKEMLPDFPNLYDTGPLNFRVVLNYNQVSYIPGGG